jgi:thiamine kinase-like enzyme
MNHEELIRSRLADWLGKDVVVEVKGRLAGGMSNSNYVVAVDGVLHVFRIPGKNADVFVDRSVEARTLAFVEPLGIDGNLLRRLDVASGCKLSLFAPGVPLGQAGPADHYRQAADILRRLHRAGPVAEFDYAPFDRLNGYEERVRREGLVHGRNYLDVRNGFLAFRDVLEGFAKTFCHNDAQTSNFLLKDDGELILVDWEFGGNNDPLYDVACFGNADFRYAEGLLPIYLGRDPEAEEWFRLYLWRTFQCLQWHNVALFKEATGLSGELGLDFGAIAEAYVAKAEAMFASAMTWR